MGIFRHRITEDTNLERVPDRQLLDEHRRRVLAESDAHGGMVAGASFGLAADIEDVLDRRGVGYPTAQEILDRARRDER